MAIGLRLADTHLVLNRAALFRDDHPEVARQDLEARLRPGERIVAEPGETPALRITLPRRMHLRGGRSWVTAGKGA